VSPDTSLRRRLGLRSRGGGGAARLRWDGVRCRTSTGAASERDLYSACVLHAASAPRKRGYGSSPKASPGSSI
jgi:hypothetical protein